MAVDGFHQWLARWGVAVGRSEPAPCGGPGVFQRHLRALAGGPLVGRRGRADPLRVAEIHERLRAIGADSAPARAATILAGLGFDEAAQARPVSSFSGGWRMRVALATPLFRHPDFLFLD